MTISPGTRRFLLPVLLVSAPACQADSLLDIYNLALARDPQLGEARARYAADYTLLAQGRARLLPTVSLRGSTARNSYAASVEYSYADGFNAHSYGVNIEQSLLNLQAWYVFQSAQDAERRARATLTQAEQELILRVARAYFDVLRSVDNLAAFTAEEAAAASVLEQTNSRFDVGLAALTDVNEAQAGSDLARVNRLREERNLNQRTLALEAITGGMHDALDALRADFPITGAEPADEDAWVELAEQNSPAILTAEHDFAARGNEARAARAAQLPTLSLSASYNDTAESANQFSFTTRATNNTSVALNLSIPLYAGGLNSARKRQAYHLRDASEQALVRTRRETERSTRDSFLGVEIDVQAVQARQQAILSAQSALQATEAGVQIGTRNVVDLVVAQRTLYQALRDHANARYDYVIDTLALKQAAGVLTPEDVVALDAWLN
jgi:outer membrane protein